MDGLVPRPSPAPVFDRLQYAKTEAIKNWSRGRPGNEAKMAGHETRLDINAPALRMRIALYLFAVCICLLCAVIDTLLSMVQ